MPLYKSNSIVNMQLIDALSYEYGFASLISRTAMRSSLISHSKEYRDELLYYQSEFFRSTSAHFLGHTQRPG